MLYENPFLWLFSIPQVGNTETAVSCHCVNFYFLFILITQKKYINFLSKMGISEDVTLPTEEELTVQEVPLSGPVLKAGAFHLGKACEFENNVRLNVT